MYLYRFVHVIGNGVRDFHIIIVWKLRFSVCFNSNCALSRDILGS